MCMYFSSEFTDISKKELCADIFDILIQTTFCEGSFSKHKFIKYMVTFCHILNNCYIGLSPEFSTDVGFTLNKLGASVDSGNAPLMT